MVGAFLCALCSSLMMCGALFLVGSSCVVLLVWWIFFVVYLVVFFKVVLLCVFVEIEGIFSHLTSSLSSIIRSL